MAQKQVQLPSFQALEATMACMAEYQHRHVKKIELTMLTIYINKEEIRKQPILSAVTQTMLNAK